MVPLAEISDPKNDYNLNIPRYIDSTEPEDLQDIDAHLRGGIPNRDIDALERLLEGLPRRARRAVQAGRPPGLHRNSSVPIAEVKPTIFGHPEFTAFNATVTKLLREMEKGQHVPRLKGIAMGDKPKALIETISENPARYLPKAAPLLDPYDVYQHLMDYWAETMQDDVYMLVSEGWKAVLDGTAEHRSDPAAADRPPLFRRRAGGHRRLGGRPRRHHAARSKS